MRTLHVWTLLVMFGILDCVAGQLHEPLNITTQSRNFSLFLIWLPAPENPPNVTYIVNYRLHTGKRWHAVPQCKGTFATQCDLTCVLNQNYSNQHAVRVRAVSVSQKKSSWASLHNISYMFTVDPSPPILQIIQEDGTMIINTSMQTPPCMPHSLHIYLSYLLEIRNNNNPAEQPQQKEMTWHSETIKTDGYEGEYCMAAKTIYKIINEKMSEPSYYICYTFTQKDQNDHLMPVVGLPVIAAVIFIVVVICIIWYKTNQKAAIPKVLNFSHKRCALVISVISEENPYPLTFNKNMDQSSSATFLLSSKDSDSINEYPLHGCGYTERKTMPGNGARTDTHYGDSTSDEYMSSKGLPTNSSSDKSSDSSCLQTSGSNTEIRLRLNQIQLHNQSEQINKHVSCNMETPDTNTITMGPLLDTLHVSDCNSSGHVLLNTLSISAATDQCSENEPYDCHVTNSEDGHEQLSDCIDSDISESYVGSQHLQNEWSSGYEQRGYMSRR